MKKTDDQPDLSEEESQKTSEETNTSSKEEKPLSKKRKFFRGFFRVVFPFWSIRQSISVAKKSYQQSKDNLQYIRALKDDAKAAVQASKEKERKNDQFESTMHKYAPDYQAENDAYSYFLRKKRTLLSGALFFLIMGVIGLCTGLIDGQFKRILLSCMTIIASQPLFFVLALGSQLRLWQLETRRLSVEERGGLQDFMKERNGWYWEVIDPQLGYKLNHPNPVVKEIKND